MTDAQYRADNVIVTTGEEERPAAGFAADSFVTAAYDTDRRSKHMGAGGEGRHLESMDKSGTITVTLADYSQTNQYYQQLADSKRIFPVNVIDKSSNGAVVKAQNCTVQKIPDFERAAGATENAWIFQAIKMDIKHAGARQV